MIAIMPGLFGAGMQGLAINYHMAGEGLWAATLFQIFRMLLLGLVGIPGTFWLLSRAGGRYWLLFFQLMGSALFLVENGSAIITGLAFVLTSGPYWGLFSLRNATALSRDNHGNETALLNYLQTIVCSVGIFAGGYVLDYHLYKEAMVVGGLLLALSTQALAIKRKPEPLAKRAWAILGWRKPTTRLTLMVSSLFSFMDFGMPTWMRLIGLSPLSTGLMLSLRPIIGLILTPVVGHLIYKGGLRAGRAGGVLLFIGWGILLGATYAHELLLPALVVLTIGIGLIGPLEVNRWFKRRSAAALVAREWILAAGRVPSAAIIIPAVFLMPPLFPFLGALLGALFFVGAKKRS